MKFSYMILDLCQFCVFKEEITTVAIFFVSSNVYIRIITEY